MEGSSVAARVLVVDDEPEMSSLLARGLQDAGYAVDVASDGVEALSAFSASPFDLAVVDVMMPGMSGFELCRRLREVGPGTGILLLTAWDAIDDRVRGLDSGADDYLTKPFAFAELDARLRALRRRSAGDAARLTVGNVELDLMRQQVHVGDRLLRLSRTEFDVLRLLAENEDRVLTRTEMLETIWGSTAYSPNIVDQYVSYVRKKLDPLGSTVHIATARGVGYRLAAG